MFSGAQLGAHVWVATPAGYEPKPEAVEWALRRGTQTGGTCTLTHDPMEAASGADVVYTDAWASMGQEAEKEERQKVFLPYQVNCDLLAHAKYDAAFHALSAGASRRRGYG